MVIGRARTKYVSDTHQWSRLIQILPGESDNSSCSAPGFIFIEPPKALYFQGAKITEMLC